MKLKIKIATICASLLVLSSIGLLYTQKSKPLYNSNPDVESKFVGSESISGYSIPMTLDQIVLQSDLILI